MRQLKREVKIGNVTIGGNNPIAVQTMLNVPVEDIEGNVAQAKRCEAAGCQILRVTCPSAADAKCIEAVKNAVNIPIVADIHFDYKAALACADVGVDKIRINPGNIGDDDRVKAVVQACQQKNITITSVADGRMLGFLTIRELCTIVGVALDNAIAAVRAEPDPEKRLIKVAVYSQGGFAMLRFEHYTETAPALDADGLPQGTDLKSVRTAVQQHGGSMTLHWENNWCTLRILFPLPKNK